MTGRVDSDGDGRLLIGVVRPLVESGGVGGVGVCSRTGGVKGMKRIDEGAVLSQDFINSFQVIVVWVS